MELIRENRRVEFCYIGEGLDGDYNPKDRNDVPLLRFDIYELVDGEWEAMDNGSYCTAMPVGTDHETIQRALKLIMDETFGQSRVKQAAEALSWMNPAWFGDDLCDHEEMT